jgi:signal peptidase I
MAQDNPAGLEGGPESPGGVGSPPRAATRSRVARIVFWALTGLAVVLLIVSIVMLFVITRVYTVSTPTMENTVPSGDRVLLAPGTGVRRGDVVVLRVPVSVSGTSTVFVKRVIGLPGDNVRCCDSRGRVTVNGRALDESYLHPGDPPSRSGFSVSLGPGQIWVMGDRRAISEDSRKWGPVPLRGVLGRVALVNQGFSLTALHTPRTFVTEGLAPADTRANAYTVLALLIAGSVLALLVLALTGITRFVIAQRRSPHGPPVPSEAVPAIEAVKSVEAVPSIGVTPSASAGGVGVGGDSPTPPGPPEGLADA